MECHLEVHFLNMIFTYNLFLMTHNNDMSDSMVHVIYSLHTKNEVDISASEARNPSASSLLP